MKKILTTTLSLLVLSACGGSGGGKGGDKEVNTIKTGQVEGISGLGYKTFNTEKTETRSGVINTHSEFSFEEGETITLYLGGAEIGSTQASTTLNLFDFFPNLPTDAAELRKALRLPEFTTERLQAVPRGIYFSQMTGNSVYRASNIMHLLLALDNDKDSSNGLDLLTGDWHTKLANESDSSLDLNSNMFEFTEAAAMTLFQHTYGKSLNMDISEPLATLYDFAQVTIQVQRRESYTTPNLQPPTSSNYEYDTKQRVVKETQTTSYDYQANNSNPPKIRVLTFEYDASGNLIKDFNESDTNSDGALESFSRRTYTYNDFGKVLTQTYDYDHSAEDSDFRRQVFASNYDNNRVLRLNTSTKQDDTGDGIFDSFDKQTYTYYDNGLLKLIQNKDVDSAGETITVSNGYEYIYNDQGQVTGYHYIKSYDGETPSLIDAYDFTYEGNTVTSTLNYAQSGDTSYKDIFTETFDDNGLLTNKTKAEYINNALDAYGEVTYTFDDKQRLTQCHFQVDNTGDEQFNYATKFNIQYNANGINGISWLNDYDNDGVFTPDTEEYEAIYGDQAQVISENYNSRSFTYSTNTSNEGVRYLIHEYLYLDRDMLIRQRNNKCYLDVSSVK